MAERNIPLPPNVKTFDTASMNQRQWEYLVQTQMTGVNKISSDGRQESNAPLPPLNLPYKRGGEEYEILSSFYKLDDEITAPDTIPGDLFMKKLNHYHTLAERIKKGGRFRILDRLYNIVSGEQLDSHDQITKNTLLNDVSTLYLTVCEPNRFLVGLKDGVYWKRINLTMGEEEALNPNLPTVGALYLMLLGRIGRHELPAVPEAMIHPTLIGRVKIPAPAEAITDLLEDAYFNQRYVVPPEGAEVRFRRAGDLERMVVVQSGGVILSRVITSYGDAWIGVNLDDGFYISHPDGPSIQPKWATIVAETYRDLVTAKEVHITRRYRPLRNKEDYQGSNQMPIFQDDPQVIYIPRKVRIKDYEEPRDPYQGPPRPVKPHPVTGHSRKGDMTEKHRQELLKLEKEWGIEFVKNIPVGRTYVRPHFSPKGSEEFIRYLPIFIKRRIETQLTQSLRVREDDINQASS